MDAKSSRDAHTQIESAYGPALNKLGKKFNEENNLTYSTKWFNTINVTYCERSRGRGGCNLALCFFQQAEGCQNTLLTFTGTAPFAKFAYRERRRVGRRGSGWGVDGVKRRGRVGCRYSTGW